MLWVRFFFARSVARGDMSVPWRWRWRGGMWGWRREQRWRGMQPVPVQRSRMRRALGGGCEGSEERRRREARWVVMFSVSGLEIAES